MPEQGTHAALFNKLSGLSASWTQDQVVIDGWSGANGHVPTPQPPRSTLNESGGTAPGVAELLGDLVHITRRGAAAQRGEQPLAILPRALGDHLDPPVGQVSRMTGQT